MSVSSCVNEELGLFVFAYAVDRILTCYVGCALRKRLILASILDHKVHEKIASSCGNEVQGMWIADGKITVADESSNRKIDHVDFGFSFPTPKNPRRSSSRLSRSDRRSAERSSRTPSGRKERESSTARSIRAASIESHGLPPVQRSSRTPQPISQPEQPNSSKRRRLSKQVPVQISIDAVDSPEQSKQTVSHHQASDIPGEHERQERFSGGSTFTPQNVATMVSNNARQDSPLFVPESDDKENADANADYETNLSSKKQQRSTLHASTRSVQVPLAQIGHNSVVQSVEADALDNAISTKQANVASGSDGLEGSYSNLHDATLPRSAVEPSANATKKRKKRKPVILVKKKRRSSEIRRESSVRATNETTSPDQSMHTNVTDEQAEGDSSASERGDESANTVHQSLLPNLTRTSRRVSGRRNRLSVSTSPAPRGLGDEEEDETYVEEDVSPEPITPAPPRRGRPTKKQKDGPQASTGREYQQRSAKSSFPIQTYRIANAETLPTITEEDEEDGRHSDEESSRMPITFSGRSQPNAVDVLAQICRETIQSTLDKLDTAPSASASRAGSRRKRTALEAFASDLDQRLFDMSEAVENRLTLEARLRKSKRELAELQARWVEVRRQREEVALKADGIRRQNWENEEEGRRQWDVSELARATELELGKGATDEDNLELLLKEVASKVSSTRGQMGMLDRVRSFNGQLERLAAVLERR